MARAKKQPAEEVLSGDMIETGTQTTSLLGGDSTTPKKRGRANTMTVQLDDDLYDAWNDYATDTFKETREKVFFNRTVIDLLTTFLKKKGYPK